jgi:hypothetical protein
MNYGRDCGTLKSSGRDVGAILMEEGTCRAIRMWRNTLSKNATPMALTERRRVSREPFFHYCERPGRGRRVRHDANWGSGETPPRWCAVYMW